MSPRIGAIFVGFHFLLLGASTTAGDTPEGPGDHECDAPFTAAALPLCGGGISSDGGQTFVATGEFRTDDTLQVIGVMPIQASHVGRMGRLVAIAVYEGLLFQRDGERWIPWNGSIYTLTALNQDRPLESVERVQAAANLSGISGEFEVYMGYRVGNDIDYNPNPVRFSVR